MISVVHVSDKNIFKQIFLENTLPLNPNNTLQVNNKVDMWIVFKSFRKELTFALYYTTFQLFSHCAHKTDWIQCNLLNG